MGWRTFWIYRLVSLTLLVMLMMACGRTESINCDMWSSNDSNWRVGGVGEVSCTCDGVQAKDLSIKRQATQDCCNTDIVNNTLIHKDSNLVESSELTYECYFHEVAWSFIRVQVYPTLNISDEFFKCFYHDEYINCSFSRVDNPTFKRNTQYKLYSDSSSNSSLEESKSCEESKKDKNLILCSLPISPNNIRPDWSIFKLVMIDQLDTQIQEFNRSRIEMEVPLWTDGKYNVTNCGNDTCVRWNGANVNPGEIFELYVEYRHEKLSNLSRNQTVLQQRVASMFDEVRFPNPPEGNQKFYVNLRRRYNRKNAPWSEWYTDIPITTIVSLPVRPPKFLVNGFHYNSNTRQLRVYWEQLNETEFNGPNQAYIVTSRNGTKLAKTKNKLFAEFENWDEYEPTTVYIWSANSLGKSKESSRMEIPNLANIRERRLLLDRYNKTTSKLTWIEPKDKKNLLGYIVYWCTISTKHEQSCDDALPIEMNFTHEPNYNFSHVHVVFRMAVAANYSDGISSGMRWWTGKSEIPEEMASLRYVEGIIALIMLGLIFLVVQKLRKMADIRIVLPDMVETAAMLRNEPQCYPGTVPPEKFYAEMPTKCVTFEEPIRMPEIELQELPKTQPVPQRNQYVTMNTMTSPSSDGYIKPPPAR
ncbi:cytokine receptor [Drosophila eugracilis]|uniref:cytokine receptor n=1 Tax=Drosophila eugracilis TaxID=29029 RepID=UPI0007E89E3A|nr:cytokine receptor [Drosophila eugracilis]XP_017066873.1 cytokine receptor [Drosophila eugracilis]